MSTGHRFVIVHSAWLGAWAYEALSIELSALGHRTIVPDLRGHGSDRTPAEEVKFEHYVSDVVAALAADEPSVVVGHSFGGLVASAVAEQTPEQVSALIYVAGFLLPSGMSFMQAAESSPSEATEHFEMSDDGSSAWVHADHAHSAFAHDVPAADFDDAAKHMVPEPTAPLSVGPTLTVERFGSVPRFYVHTTLDRALTWEAQRWMVETVGVDGTASLDTSHVPNFSVPKLLAAELVRMADRAARAR